MRVYDGDSKKNKIEIIKIFFLMLLITCNKGIKMFSSDHVLDYMEAQPTYEHYIIIDNYQLTNDTFYEKILSFIHKTIKKYV